MVIEQKHIGCPVTSSPRAERQQGEDELFMRILTIARTVAGINTAAINLRLVLGKTTNPLLTLSWRWRFPQVALNGPVIVTSGEKVNSSQDGAPADDPGGVHLFQSFLGKILPHDSQDLHAGMDHPLFHQPLSFVRVGCHSDAPAIG